MKVKVIRPFNDKVTNKLRKPGEEFECTEARLAEIKKAGKFVEEVKPEKVAEPEKK